jgi:epoxyqueuosine reductase
VGLAGQQLVTLFAWTEQEFLYYTEGSPIRRIEHARWQRNTAVAMGNALRGELESTNRAAICSALHATLDEVDALVREHVLWALEINGSGLLTGSVHP